MMPTWHRRRGVGLADISQNNTLMDSSSVSIESTRTSLVCDNINDHIPLNRTGALKNKRGCYQRSCNQNRHLVYYTTIYIIVMMMAIILTTSADSIHRTTAFVTNIRRLGHGNFIKSSTNKRGNYNEDLFIPTTQTNLKVSFQIQPGQIQRTDDSINKMTILQSGRSYYNLPHSSSSLKMSEMKMEVQQSNIPIIEFQE